MKDAERFSLLFFRHQDRTPALKRRNKEDAGRFKMRLDSVCFWILGTHVRGSVYSEIVIKVIHEFDIWPVLRLRCRVF